MFVNWTYAVPIVVSGNLLQIKTQPYLMLTVTSVTAEELPNRNLPARMQIDTSDSSENLFSNQKGNQKTKLLVLTENHTMTL